MLRRIFAIVLIVLGLATAGAGLASGTIWRPDEVVTATLPQEPEVPVVVAAGNVLATVNPHVSVTVTADADTPVMLAMGRESDVLAWLDDSPYTEVTGLTDWDTLAVADGASEEPSEDASEDPSADASESASEDPSADASESASEDPSADASQGADDAPAEATVPDPTGSDLWIEEVTGTGELTYDWSQVDGRWMMLVATDGSQPAPMVSMTWTREVTTPLMMPGIIVGAVLFLIGLIWLIIELLVHREERRARRGARDDDHASAAVATTAEDGTPLTRRQIREATRGSGGRTAGEEKPAGVAETESTPTEHAGSPAESGEWTQIIAGPSGEADEPESEQTDAESAADGSATADGSAATDLDDWVRSGRAGADAEPMDTYASPAPGQGLDNAGVTWRGTDAADRGSADTPDEPVETGVAPGQSVDQDDDASQKPPRRRWWQRTGRAADAPAPEAPSTDESTADLAAPDDQVVADDPEESNPQASGASWRQTWGLSGSLGASNAPTPADSADTDSAGPDSADTDSPDPHSPDPHSPDTDTEEDR